MAAILGDSLFGVCLPDMIAMINVLLMRNAFSAPRKVQRYFFRGVAEGAVKG